MIHTSIEIAASPELVKSVLLDFPNFPKWHIGFITAIRTTDPTKPLQEDDSISATMAGVSFTAKIQELTSHTLSWTGPPVAGLFYGVHVFRFEKSSITPGGTTFVQEETFHGILAWMFNPWFPLGMLTKGHFNKFNADLKGEVERRAKDA